MDLTNLSLYNMQYFMLMPADKEADMLNEANLLGEESFGNFWGGTALTTLMRIVENNPEVLPLIRIKTDLSSKELSISEFLTAIQKLKIRTK